MDSIVGTFVVEFHEHVPHERVVGVISALQSKCSVIQEQSSRRFSISCETESQLTEIGVALFRTHFNSLLAVTEVSGLARAEASAYPFPKTREDRKSFPNVRKRR